MNDSEEEAWESGNRAAYLAMFKQCIRHLPEVKDDGNRLSERSDAVAILRQVCADHGDNDWDDDLHLGDIIEKHLWRHLESGKIEKERKGIEP